MIIEEIRKMASQNFNQLVETRRHIHANPELSFQEFNTAKFVSQRLKEMGIEPEVIATTGLTAEIHGRNPGKTFALRADLDALPIKEENDVEYKSLNEGIMHACGHDVHTTCLLGAAEILNQLTDKFDGTIRLIFQPGEEKMPGGATLMINEGILENPKPDGILGQHVMPLVPVGKVGFREGMYMASADEIYITVIGKGGHGAIPELIVDPVVISAQIITALQQVVSRKANPKVPSVLSIGKISTDGATNIIPDKVEMEGTFRTLNEEWREEAHKLIKQIANGIAESFGAKCEIRLEKGYPFLKNDVELTQKTRSFAEDYLGKENVVDLDLWMASEDFSFYSHHLPACFYRLGIRNEEKGITSSVHTPTFNIDEEALKIGSGLMAWLALKSLGN